ncbi:MAG TPA: hypothetical protein VJ882_04855 [Desulfuromonadales bacterium]|nr:hypothetical protein [Desulfuromonadales bacterium]
MLRSIIAVTFLFLVSFSGASAWAENKTEGETLFLQGLAPDSDLALTISESLLHQGSTGSLKGPYDLNWTTLASDKSESESLLSFSEGSGVHYHIGARIDEDEPVLEEESREILPSKPVKEDGWGVQLEAGFERQLSKRSAIDLGYRYTSNPVELDFDTFELPSVQEHHLSAGMEFYF